MCQHKTTIKRSGCTNDRPPAELYWILECQKCGFVLRSETRAFEPRKPSIAELLGKISDANDPDPKWYRDAIQAHDA